MVLGPGVRALVIETGKFADLLGPGKHWVPIKNTEVLTLNPSRALFSHIRQDDLVREAPELVAEHFDVVTTDVDSTAVVEVEGKVEMVLGPEKRALFWKDFGEVTVTTFEMEDVPVVSAKLASRLVRAGFSNELTMVSIPEGSVGLLTVDGV